MGCDLLLKKALSEMHAVLIHLVDCRNMLSFPDVLGDKNGM